jgi:hypothetical protein
MSRRFARVAVSIASLILCLGGLAEAWEAITHYQLGVQSKADVAGRFQNLPDSWPSHRGLAKLYEITEWFAWSHAVQRTGRTSGVPNVPIYPNDKRNPGEVMYQLYKGGAPISGAYVYETALGFLSHNAQDRQVHYKYFRGGSRAAWVEEHEKKEQWADCWIYQIVMNGAFDKEDRPLNLPRIENRGNSALISEAQGKFIASGLSTDRGGRVTLPKRESVVEVDERLLETERAVQTYLGDFDAQHCRALEKWAVNYAWTLDELEEYYGKSLDATRKVLTDFPK